MLRWEGTLTLFMPGLLAARHPRAVALSVGVVGRDEVRTRERCGVGKKRPFWAVGVKRKGRHRQRTVGVALNEHVRGRSRSLGQSGEIEKGEEMVGRRDRVREISVIAQAEYSRR